MILGVSHVVRGSMALDDDRRMFERLGWSLSFVERNLPVADGKRPFMSTGSTRQDLVFLRAPRGPALELIHYADPVPSTDPPMQIVLANDGDAGIAEVVHFVRDLDQAQTFWTNGVGFTRIEPRDAARERVVLAMQRPLQQWRMRLTLLRREDACHEWLLDGAGVRCVSFLSTSAAADADVLLRAGAHRATGRMAYTINQQSLSVEILKGPDGALVELIEILRSQSKG